jgi:polar amino acid transport system substrate-binding protein
LRPSGKPLALAVSLLLAAAAIAAGCSGEPTAAGSRFEPASPGVLTVATAFLPAPGFWEGRRATAGFEAQLAKALAGRLGLDRVRVIQVPFAQVVHGRLRGADLALSQVTPTAERDRFADFSTPYLTASPGVLALRDVQASDLHGLRGLRWVIARVSTLTPIVLHRIRPDSPPLVVGDRSDALQALRAGRADALLLDLPVALGLARSDPGVFHVLGQLNGGEGLAAVLPSGSSNLQIVDAAIRTLQADGTIGKLTSRWLGTSLQSVPLILTES